MRSMFSWHPRVSLTEGLGRTLRSYQELKQDRVGGET